MPVDAGRCQAVNDTRLRKLGHGVLAGGSSLYGAQYTPLASDTPARSAGLRQWQPDLIATKEPGRERCVVACRHGFVRPSQIGRAQRRL